VVNRAIKMLKDKFGEELFVSADVCLCAYTDSGHCGVLAGNMIDNDKTLPVLTQMAVDLARAGCDCVAPSDMMDGRVGAIREGLEEEGFVNTLLLAYSAKYASAYYGPFRDAAESAPQKGDRQSYQWMFAIDLRRSKRSPSISKKALTWSWLNRRWPISISSPMSAQATELPVVAYNVSGEYSMVKLMVQAGYAEEKRLVLENLTAITRAGATSSSLIICATFSNTDGSMADPIRSRQIFARATKAIPGGVSSPVRAFRAVGGDPIFMDRGEGHLSSIWTEIATSIFAVPGDR